MNTIYYIVELHLDNTYSWNGLRTIVGYKIVEKELLLLFELICKTDGNFNYLLSNEEEIQQWLDENDIKDEYNFIQL